MLKSLERMDRKRFSSVFAQSVPHHTPHFLLRIFPTPVQERSHGAVVVSKRVVGSAVARNRLKRRIYHILGDTLPLPTPPLDVIVIAKRGSGAVPFSQMKDELQNFFRKTQVH